MSRAGSEKSAAQYERNLALGQFRDAIQTLTVRRPQVSDRVWVIRAGFLRRDHYSPAIPASSHKARNRPASFSSNSSGGPLSTNSPLSKTRTTSAWRKGPESMRHHETRPARKEPPHRLLGFLFGYGINRAGRLVENQDSGIREKSPGEAGELALSQREGRSLSPTPVSKPCGRASKRSRQSSRCNASRTSSSEASGRANRMFSNKLPPNKWFCCGTIARCRCSQGPEILLVLDPVQLDHS